MHTTYNRVNYLLHILRLQYIFKNGKLYIFFYVHGHDTTVKYEKLK